MIARLGKWTLTVALSERPPAPVLADHPDVTCPSCSTKYVACDVGNHYCPGCGENSEEAMAVA